MGGLGWTGFKLCICGKLFLSSISYIVADLLIYCYAHWLSFPVNFSFQTSTKKIPNPTGAGREDTNLFYCNTHFINLNVVYAYFNISGEGLRNICLLYCYVRALTPTNKTNFLSNLFSLQILPRLCLAIDEKYSLIFNTCNCTA